MRGRSNEAIAVVVLNGMPEKRFLQKVYTAHPYKKNLHHKGDTESRPVIWEGFSSEFEIKFFPKYTFQE